MESDAIGTAAANADISVLGLIADADPVVKLVMFFLFLASMWSWFVIGEKLFSLGGARKKARQFEDAFWNGRTEDLDLRPGAGGDAASRVFSAAAREWSDARRVTPGSGEAAALVTRAERSMRATIDRELGKAGNGLGVLATVGSASPFIGLFGTVWGIMNAFLNIAQQQDTSLGTVAGPIAEALFATGMGLVAAIPAVIFYNKFTGDLTRFADQLDTFSQDVLVRLSRRASDPTRD
ncbi:MAG: MotA/TolQ/ExbB proton channel family protein [Hyphomonas sp.]|nr:MotA/TolQ/ExbB proton channel family protein [Hyphomonas sp.]MCA8904018.1 MotA/TolQ/ExbB proton channel family protein [Hyphomonas sp.]MCB9970699.1 MotA/TolQ/ExbB proton channel family protein [Hyphomonas sp.]HPE48886.1 MotA/TolQ/ExbB proton channel family protein [Hyphomonas sp.]